jgi:hypothetical protein
MVFWVGARIVRSQSIDSGLVAFWRSLSGWLKWSFTSEAFLWRTLGRQSVWDLEHGVRKQSESSRVFLDLWAEFFPLENKNVIYIVL